MAYLLIYSKYVCLGWLDMYCNIKYLGYTKVNCLGLGSFNAGSFIISFWRSSCIWGICWILGAFQELVKFNPMTSFGCTGNQIPQFLGFDMELLFMDNGSRNCDGHCFGKWRSKHQTPRIYLVDSIIEQCQDSLLILCNYFSIFCTQSCSTYCFSWLCSSYLCNLNHH